MGLLTPTVVKTSWSLLTSLRKGGTRVSQRPTRGQRGSGIKGVLDEVRVRNASWLCQRPRGSIGCHVWQSVECVVVVGVVIAVLLIGGGGSRG